VSEQLQSLAEKWRRRARRKFADAEHETGEARRALEHAATCEANCAEELETALTNPDQTL